MITGYRSKQKPHIHLKPCHVYSPLSPPPTHSPPTHTHRHPYHILTLPLDPSTLTEEQRAAREKKKMAAKARKYVEEEEDEEEESWDQSKYRDLIKDL